VSPEQLGISGVLILPTVLVTRSRVSIGEPLVDYSKSVFLTSNEYLRQVKNLAAKRNDASKAKEARKVAIEQHKRKCEEERRVQLQRKKEREEAKAGKAREKGYWADVASRGWGNKL
jgi:cation transport regulator ChaB